MHVKATAVRSAIAGVERLFGPEAWMRVRAALPAGVAAELDRPLIPTRMIPIHLSAALHETIREVLGAGDLDVNRRVGVEAARTDFGGVYSIFLRVADYETTLRRLERAWRQYNSQGTLTWVTLTRDCARVVTEGTAGYTEPMWYATTGRVEGILRLAGATAVEVHVLETSPAHCIADFRWR